ncbi:MAG: replicative DNA helicase [Myxococcales bacterium]|nr:replicative DNA helicase [Myxococcales bacterium]MCB9648847.1 replicative DNA helicase [Deltaproteobacteria bacterium]
MRVPPQDVDAERAVLGSVLIDNEAMFSAVEDLNQEDFYRPAHQLIFTCMTELVAKSEPVDAVTLSAQLKAKGQLEAAGGLAAIVALGEAVPTAANVKYYADIVKKKSMLRRLISAATEIATNAFDSTDPETTVDEAEKSIFEIARQKARQGMTPVSEIVVEAFKRIERLAEEKRAVTGVSTGINDLDIKLSGLQPSDLIIVAGRPSMGKTAFSIGMGLHAAVATSKSVAVFSLEMSKESLVTRMLCSEGRIDSSKLRGGFLTEEDWPRLGRAAGKLSEARIFIDDQGNASVLEVRAKCRRISAEHGLDLVVIDYLQLMRGSASAQSREQEISEISRGLKTLAKELRVPVVALSQLNRGVEQRTDKRPGLSDLRESGAIEQDADVIMFVYRDEVYNKETEDRGVAEIIVGKQRNGPIGTVRCKFFHEFTRFDNLVGDDRPAVSGF